MFTNLNQNERKQFRENAQRISEIRARFEELANALESEKRALTDAEKEERSGLESELQLLQLRNTVMLQNANASEPATGVTADAFGEVLRSFLRGNGVPEEFAELRAAEGLRIPSSLETRANLQDSTSVASVQPITIKDLIEPLEKGLIFDKVGTKIQHGIEGMWNFPVIGSAEASWEDENAEVGDSKLDLSHVSPKPKRLSIAFSISRRAINQSAGKITEIVLKQMNLATQRTLNKTMFSTTQLGTAGKTPTGVFVEPGTTLTYTEAKGVTRSDLLGLKAGVEGTGVQLDGTAAFVMSTAMYYKLKDTPIDKGSGRFCIDENNRIDGTPVYVTNYLKDTEIGYGIFSYNLLGFFGDMVLGVDTSSAAVLRKNVIECVLNVDSDMLALRKEAFGLLKKA